MPVSMSSARWLFIDSLPLRTRTCKQGIVQGMEYVENKGTIAGYTHFLQMLLP